MMRTIGITATALLWAASPAAAEGLKACYRDAFAQFDRRLATVGGYYERSFTEPGPLGLQTQTARRQTRALEGEGRSESLDPVTGVVDARKTFRADRIAFQFPDPKKPGEFMPEFEVTVERCTGPDAFGVYEIADISTVPGDPAIEVRSYIAAGPDAVVMLSFARPAGSNEPFRWSFTETLTLPR